MSRSKKEISIIILKAIFVAGAIITIAVLPGTSLLLKYFNKENSKDNKKLRKYVWNLKQGGYVKITENGNDTLIKVTEKGKRRVLKYDFDNLKIKKPKKWDGKWRFVMFDVPERRKQFRDTLNFKLKEMGALPFQKSSFITPYDCKNEIDFIAKYYYAQKYLKYIVALSINDEQQWRGKFRL